MNYFPKGNSMNWDHGLGPLGCGAMGHSGPSVHASAAGILWIEGVHDDLICIVHLRVGRRLACHAWRGWLTGVEARTRSGGPFSTRSSPTWSTEDRDSHCGPCGRRWGRAWASDEERTQGMLAMLRGLCGGTLASVLLPAVVVVSPLPQRPVGWG
jgi:hypothetical protein